MLLLVQEVIVNAFMLQIAQRALQRKRMYVGAAVLTFGGLAILSFLLWPLLAVAIVNPTELLVSWASVLTSVVIWLQALGEAGSVILRIIPEFIPTYVWMILFSAVSGLGLLWGVSFWRFTRIPHRA